MLEQVTGEDFKSKKYLADRENSSCGPQFGNPCLRQSNFITCLCNLFPLVPEILGLITVLSILKLNLFFTIDKRVMILLK